MQVDSQALIQALEACWPGCTREMPSLPDSLRLVLDSRELRAGDVFIAVPGVASDGRRYISRALEAEAALVLFHLDEDHLDEQGYLDEQESASPRDKRLIGLEDLKSRLGEWGRRLFAVPGEMEIIGVTGTNGKSSVTHYIAALSEILGRPCGIVGTLGHGRPGHLREGRQTTPGPLALQAMLGGLASQGVTRIAMEVSSHALDQNRLEGCPVKAAVFTNLSRDHLDYHPGMGAYAAAKARLFKRPELELAVVNADDSLARLMLAGLPPDARVLATGSDEATTLRVLDWQPHPAGQRVLVAGPRGEFALELALMGRFNLDNVLLAIATLYGLGESLDALVEAAESLAPVPGRMQLVTAPGRPKVVVDYAHTPDALDNALQALQAHLGRQGELWCLFGCGGERDTGKRSQMARVAATRARRLVITDDNPRGEDAALIRHEILAGLDEPEDERIWCLAGREQAIRCCIQAAKAEDVILVAGKGHETYQEIDGVRHDFSDVRIVRDALNDREATR
ncbi:UDP-N-acetylmuramoyl-L-alanyl-D-glutamate--2,6-diaminopimelate ligase [Pistricoccus aurantiacus]|uniref:UDP-N-acetylmuramoyl-L-alanyl-D-glutamate--2, 6-diaminopimelate ligase n=1 Tax=Pistricoccus aurantiacus TaxID=1883414 RepID=UPI003644AF92